MKTSFIENPLDYTAFVKALTELLPNAKNGAAKVWADLAQDCVRDGPYVDFVMEPDEIALVRWYDTLLASFILLKRSYGGDIAAEVCNLSLEDRCLYPYEMERTAEAIQAGASSTDLIYLMQDDLLTDPALRFPKLWDVLNDT